MVCMDHFYLSHISRFHVMNTTMRYSSCRIVASISMPDNVLAFESCWLEQFRPPTAMLVDQAFNNNVFTGYLSSLDMKFQAEPQRHQNTNILECKHGAFRSIFLRLTRDDSSNHELAAKQAVRTLNGLCGSYIFSAFKMRKVSKSLFQHPLIYPQFIWISSMHSSDWRQNASSPLSFVPKPSPLISSKSEILSSYFSIVTMEKKRQVAHSLICAVNQSLYCYHNCSWFFGSYIQSCEWGRTHGTGRRFICVNNA